MMIVKVRKDVLVAFFAVLFAALRIPFLPAIETALLIFLLFLHKRIDYSILSYVIIIMCSHHYAIMDEYYRYNQSLFPSIYTQTFIGGIKYLDIIVLALFAFSLLDITNIRRIKNLRAPFLLTLFAGLSFFNIDINNFAADQILFTIRSLLLIFAILLPTLNLDIDEMSRLCELALITWILNMVFSIIVKMPNPYYRSILGFKWFIFFAGDEYLSLGYYASILVLFMILFRERKSNCWINIRKVKILVFIGYILALISQRKGAIELIFIMFIVMNISYDRHPIVCNLGKMFLMLEQVVIYFFLTVLYPFLPQSVQLLFYDYNGLAVATMQSIDYLRNSNFIKFLFGLCPFGKYKIIGLKTNFDYATSFGGEVGQEFRYQLWSFPGGRTILNTGIIGFIYYYAYLIWMWLRRTEMAEFYLYFSIATIFALVPVTPVNALAFGICIAGLVIFREKMEPTKNESYEKN